MNNLQPFEKHLADQLQQLPVPDREEGWKEMCKLLDRELPEGGTAWSGNQKWWWMGITVAIIITGLWMSEEYRKKELASSRQNSINNNSTVPYQSANQISPTITNDPKTHEQNSVKPETPSTSSAIDHQQDYASAANNSDIVAGANKNRIAKEGNSKGIETGIAASDATITSSSKG